MERWMVCNSEHPKFPHAPYIFPPFPPTHPLSLPPTLPPTLGGVIDPPTHLHTELCKASLLRVCINGTAAKVSLEIVEDDTVSGHHHTHNQGE